MNPTLYRAVPVTDSSIRGEQQTARATTRLPMHVVDNVWEYLRPDSMPCRRHAVYASPTPELAAKYITAAANERGTTVYELLLSGPAKVAQLHVEDAKQHQDIKAIGELLQSCAEKLLASSWESKQLAAVLFMPGASKTDLLSCLEGSTFASEFGRSATAISTFRREAKTEVMSPRGEVFLELAPHSTYVLKSLATS